MDDRNFYTPREPDPDVEEALNFVEKLRSIKDAGEDNEALLSEAYAHPVEFQKVQTNDMGEIHLVEEESDAPTVTESKMSTPTLPRWRRIMERILPVAGDPWWEIGRKLMFLVALVLFLGSMAMLINESVIIPKQNEELTNEIYDLMIQSQNGQLTEEEEAYDGYPEGISTSFKKLYFLNSDVRGWLKFPGCGVDRWVMHSPSKEYYLYRDIYKNHNKNGSLFFDVENNIAGPSSHYKSLVIYGHNMSSGQMFARLNDLASSLAAMKNRCTPITLETLYNTAQYKIFAVVIQDPNAKIEHYYSIQATSFQNDTEFMSYVGGLRERSLYDFNSVDVKADDELLVLYTCSPKSVAGFDDARLAVIARKVRKGESANTDTSKITQNKDVIMPYAWYKTKKKTPHAVYTGGSTATTTTRKPTTTGGGQTTLPGDTTTGDGNTTLPDPFATTLDGGTTLPGNTAPVGSVPAGGTTTNEPGQTTPPSGTATTVDGTTTTLGANTSTTIGESGEDTTASDTAPTTTLAAEPTNPDTTTSKTATPTTLPQPTEQQGDA